jgi:ribonuclease HI
MRQPTTEFTIAFDGGTSPGGNGYGSWSIEWNGFKKLISRAKFTQAGFGLWITNNVAEYLALIRAVEWLGSVKDKKDYTVKIIGDSQLVLRTLTGRYQTHKPHLIPLRDKCRRMLAEFRGYTAIWQPRKHNVRRFGH